MSMFGGLRPGYWYYRSELDPRFNINGSGNVGMFMTSTPEGEAHIAKLNAQGIETPKDLEFGYMKD